MVTGASPTRVPTVNGTSTERELGGVAAAPVPPAALLPGVVRSAATGAPAVPVGSGLDDGVSGDGTGTTPSGAELTGLTGASPGGKVTDRRPLVVDATPR